MSRYMKDYKLQILLFFIVAYSFTWFFFIGFGILKADPQNPSDINPIAMFGLLGPMIAAFLLSSIFYGKAGATKLLRRALIWRVHTKWYALMLVGFPAAAAFAIFIGNLFLGSDLPLHTLSNVGPQTLIIQLIIVGFGEEFGWRGFALPRLQIIASPITAAVVLALVHLLWHLPGFWMGTGFHNVPFWIGTAWIIPFTILYVWVYNNTKGSILIAALFHGLFGITLSAVPILPSERTIPINSDLITMIEVPTSAYPYAVFVTIIWLIAIFIIFKTNGTLNYMPDEARDQLP